MSACARAHGTSAWRQIGIARLLAFSQSLFSLLKGRVTVTAIDSPITDDDSGESQSFVLRMRTEQLRQDDEPPSRRLLIRMEHVNRTDVTQHHTIDSALSWLRARMTALLTRPDLQDPDLPPPDQT